MKIGKTIKRIRNEKNMTLRQLSEKSGVALATLSRIENDKMLGTVKSHSDIARTLNIALADLYSGFEVLSEKVELKNRTSEPDIFVHNDKASYDILTKKMLSKKMMPLLLKLAPDAKTSTEKSAPGTEKFIYVLNGKMEVVINNKTYALSSQASLYFDASLPHYWKNISNKHVRALCIVTPPAL